MRIIKDSDAIAELYMEGFWDKFKKPIQQTPTQQPQPPSPKEGELFATQGQRAGKIIPITLLMTKKYADAGRQAFRPPGVAEGDWQYSPNRPKKFDNNIVDQALQTGQWVLASGGNPNVPATQEEIDFRSRQNPKWYSEYLG